VEATQFAVPILWISGAFVFYAYIGYPVLMWCLARCFGRPRKAEKLAEEDLPPVSLLIVAHNEEAMIGKRIQSALAVDYPPDKLEVLVVCDGCTDATVSIARAYTGRPVRVLDLQPRLGKAAALSRGCAEARHAFLVLADVRQSWEPGAVKLLLENFADPAVGAVSGNLVLEKPPGALAGVGLYWRYEKWLRAQESRLYSMVSVSGSVSALRRELFQPIPKGTILDDLYWPLLVAMQGFRVILEERARVYDHLPENSRDEFQRKVRTLSGNLQLLGLLPAALLPWRNPVWFQYLCHKMFRLIVPWALVAMFAASAVPQGFLYRAAFWGQALFYAAALVGMRWKAIACRLRPVSIAASFVVLNAAAWLAFWVWLSGKTTRSWVKVTYQIPVSPRTESRRPATALAAPQGDHGR
jgi:biofilm PGA synthesis N-glycosyltransferase PgaC